jgi:peptidoglycan DL-endopeptidase CwlO
MQYLGSAQDRSVARRKAPATVLALSLLAASVIGPAYPAAAAPGQAGQLARARAEATRVQKTVEDMDAQLEGVIESCNQVQADLDHTDQQITLNEQRLEEATTKLDAAVAVLNERVTSIYRAGDVNVVGVVLGTTDFQDFLARIDFLGRIGAQDARIKTTIEQAKRRVEAMQKALQDQRARETLLRSQLTVKRDDIQGRLDARKRYLDSLNGRIRQLVEAERQRQIAAAEALRRQALGGQKPSWYPQPDQIYPRDKVVDIALAQLGKPYQWGATGPGTFDCSGLVLYCYAYVGVYLPRVSQEQARFGAPVAKADLQPGDLVYFGYGADPARVHHIGMYIGDGRFIHAPATGDVVKISLLSDRDDFAGATRP